MFKINLWVDGEGLCLFEVKDGNAKEIKDRKISIGDRASIGYGASIGYRASIGDRASIKKFEKFSEISVQIHLGITMQNGKGVFYKAIRPNLESLYNDYKYKVNGDKLNLKRDQNIECGEGWHFTNLWNAISFGKEKGEDFIIISAEIELDDILAIYQKVRVRKYTNVKIVKIEGLC